MQHILKKCGERTFAVSRIFTS